MTPGKAAPTLGMPIGSFSVLREVDDSGPKSFDRALICSLLFPPELATVSLVSRLTPC